MQALATLTFPWRHFSKRPKKKIGTMTPYLSLLPITPKNSKKEKFQSTLGRYRVPLLFFHPSINLKEKTERKVTQHADILSSVMDFLNLELEERLLYGSSVFGKGQGRVINKISNTYYLLKDHKLVTYDGSSQKFFDVGAEYLKMSPSKSNDDLLEELKAYIQYTNNGLRNNSIYGLD